MRLLQLCLSLLLSYSAGQQYIYGPPQCSPMVATMNPSGCIQLLRQKAEDPNAFWFGTGYASLCGTKSPRFAECMRLTPDNLGNYDTLGSRLFADAKFTSAKYLSQLSDIFHVSYVSPPGVYSGCNTTRFGIQLNAYEIHPQMVPLPAWNTRNPPQFRISSCNLQQLCTIVLYDAGVGVVHTVWVNWPKNGDIGTYSCPNTNMRREPNPYVYLVFRQSFEIQNYTDKRYDVWEFRMPDFQKQYQLQGPIAMNYMMIQADEFSLNNLERMGILQNCPTLLAEAVQQEGNGMASVAADLQLKMADPTSLRSMDVWMTVKFFDKPKGDVWVDPIQNGFIQRYAIATEPTVTLVSRSVQPTSADLATKLFTLVMVEIPRGATPVSPASKFFQGVGTTQCHWLVYNIPGDQISQGTKTVSYIGDTNPHNVCVLRQYYLILYQQTKPVTSLSSFVYMATCTPNNFNCPINLFQLVSSNGLELAAFSRFQVIC